jgi:hypothetical protein
VSEDLEKLVAVEMLNGFGQLTALLKGTDEIRPSLGSTGGEGILLRTSHRRILRN